MRVAGSRILEQILDRLKANKMIRRIVPRGLVRSIRKALPVSAADVQRHSHTYLHPVAEKLPPVVLGYGNVPADGDPHDAELARRLLAAFERCRKKAAGGTGMWKLIEDNHHRSLLAALSDGKADALGRLLANMYQEEFLIGIDHNKIATEDLFAGGEPSGYLGHVKDRLVGLAEAIGCLPLENPEAGRWGENLFVDTDQLVEMIEKAMGITIAPPDVGAGRYGLRTSRGIFNYRDVQALFTAWRVKELLKRDVNPRVCEIGGGLGKVAYYCHLFGIRNYTIIDLPQVNVFQGYYLAKALPGMNVMLYGEDGETGTPEGLRVYPSSAFPDLTDNTFDLVLNQDSMPEMGHEVALNYVTQIKRKSDRWFLSINHESEARFTGGGAHPVIFRLVEESGGYERVYRMPFWLRRGYAEELYRVVK